MADGINRVMLLGNIGADVELRYGQSGMAVLNIRLATTETFLDRDKAKRERTDWHNVVIFGKRAEGLGSFLAKGMQILVEGRIQTSSYDKDGEKRYRTEIVANNVVACGGKRDGGERAPQGAARERQPAAKASEWGDAARGGGYGAGGEVDDVPFVTCEANEWGL